MHPKSGSMGLLLIDLLHKTDVLRELVRGFERKIPKSTEISYKLGIKWNLSSIGTKRIFSIQAELLPKEDLP